MCPQQQTAKFGSTVLFEATNGAAGDTMSAENTGQSNVTTRKLHKQAEYGQSLELPGTYVRCGACRAHFAIAPDDLGKGKGRRLHCSLCGNTWFQSKDRINKVREGMEMVSMPQTDLDRIELNMKEGKNPDFVGDVKLYVGNVAFECTEEQLYKEFSGVGNVGEVSIAYDNVNNRPKGFAFIVMRTQADAENACKLLNDANISGRNIKVHFANY